MYKVRENKKYNNTAYDVYFVLVCSGGIHSFKDPMSDATNTLRTRSKQHKEKLQKLFKS